MFLSCPKKKVVLPGTLIGLAPGVIHEKIQPLPDTEEREVINYFQRSDQFWISYDAELPYNRNFISESILDKEMQLTDIGNFDEKERYHIFHGSMMNPYALAHKINHPPPETSPNVLLVDLDIPFSFFPSSFTKYMPFMLQSACDLDYLPALAAISMKTISHGEELFVDYLYDKRVPVRACPEWLLEPPEVSPMLEKKDYQHETPMAL